MVTFLRIGFGFATLAVFPAARRRIDREDWPRVALIGVVWFAWHLPLYHAEGRDMDTAFLVGYLVLIWMMIQLARSVNNSMPEYTASILQDMLNQRGYPVNGTPIAVAVHELLDYLGVKTAHYPIRTASYAGIGKRVGDVQVLGLDPIAERLAADDRGLFVDDVFDTGLSMEATIARLHRLCPPPQQPEVRVATTYFKPASNRTSSTPDYYVHETEQWLVFPHELDGLSEEESLENNPGGEILRDVLSRHR